MKIFKRLLLLLLLLSIIAAATGYYYGLRPSDIVNFFSPSQSGYSSLQDSTNSKTPVDTLATTQSNKSKNKKHDGNSSKKINEKIEFLPLPINPFASLDKYSRNCPASEEISVESLAKYLQKNTKSDIEKARAIYIWLTKNISYDFVSYNSGVDGDCSAEGVLKNKKAVCEGFSNLFLALGKQMNLEIQKVSGYAKGYGYEGAFDKTNHAWNIIKIDGQWKVFDATWGEGFGKNINGKLVSTKQFNDYWFNVNPFAAIFSHLPENKSMQNIKPELDLRTFVKFPRIDESYFELGFDPATIYNSFYQNRMLTFPSCYNCGTYVKANSAPKFEILYVKGSYNFEFYAPRGISIAVIDAKNNWTYFERNKGVFSLNYKPVTSGKIKISIKYEKGGDDYSTIMEYAVK